MSVILTGVKELQVALTRMVERQSAATRDGLGKCAHLLEREIKATLSLSSHEEGEPTSSAPGEPPALVSGDLRRGVQVEGPHTASGTQWAAEVGPTSEYSRIQELGGRTGRGGRTELPARPFVEPSLEKMKPVMAAEMKAAWAAGQRL